MGVNSFLTELFIYVNQICKLCFSDFYILTNFFFFFAFSSIRHRERAMLKTSIRIVNFTLHYFCQLLKLFYWELTLGCDILDQLLAGEC